MTADELPESEPVDQLVAAAERYGARLAASDDGGVGVKGDLMPHHRAELESRHDEVRAYVTERAQLQARQRALQQQEDALSVEQARRQYGNSAAGGTGGSSVPNPYTGGEEGALKTRVTRTLERGHAPSRLDAEKFATIRIFEAYMASKSNPSYQPGPRDLAREDDRTAGRRRRR